MIAVQHQLAFARPLSGRVRSVRRPFRPARGEGAYRLPHDVRDRLSAALAPFSNRDAAFRSGRVPGALPLQSRPAAGRVHGGSPGAGGPA
jgi:hypothetical protein